MRDEMQDTEVITYSLRDGQRCSCSYYRAVAEFTDEVVRQGEQFVGTWLDAFLGDVHNPGLEAPRTRAEYIFDLLTLGTLWRIYGRDALAFPKAAGRLLEKLADLREKNARWKKLLDLLRGPLMRWLIPYQRSPHSELPPLTLKNFDSLLNWLSANGRFAQEVKRLQTWREFFARQVDDALPPDLSPLLAFARWFEKRSKAVLACYTPHVDRFLAEKHPHYRGREDFIFCGRQPVEYHLNMVGTEILNRALRESFLRTAKKVVLVPPCMRAQPDERCKALPTPLGSRCTACTPNCRIHQLTKLGEKHGFAVFTLPDDLRVFSTQSVQTQSGAAVGIIGVSCVLTNAPGGWQAREIDIPAQGVLLDYCGCSYHWHKQGIPTSVNFHQLLHILDNHRMREHDQNHGGE
jgi:uncharacterized protein